MTLVTPRIELHRRPVEGDADDLLRFQHTMFWLRLLGIVIVLTQGGLYQMADPVMLWLAVGIIAGVIAVQGRLLDAPISASEVRARATALLVADAIAVYLIGTVFTRDVEWIGYYFYPLLSLEATLVVGLWAGIVVTALSVVAYLAQLVIHVSFGHLVEPRSAVAAVSLIGATGGFVTIHAHMASRGQDHLRAMLHLTSALARHESQAEAMRHLDRQLHAAIGARVRSVAIREVDGRYRLTTWQTGEERFLTREQLLRAFGNVDEMSRRLAVGDAVTVETDAWSVVTASLGLPEWATAVTLVPIVAEGRWVGVLPVLWPTRAVPDADQLRLLYGLAGQVGLALARRELEQMRRDATVDPLTGLLNDRAIGAELQAFVARAARAGGRLAVLMVDLETMSPAPGAAIRRPSEPPEAVFRAASQAIRSALRGGDVAGRHGADRLLVIAADADGESAGSLAERIAERLAAVEGIETLRVSAGVASFPVDGPTAADLVDAADAALAPLPALAGAAADASRDAGEAAA